VWRGWAGPTLVSIFAPIAVFQADRKRTPLTVSKLPISSTLSPSWIGARRRESSARTTALFASKGAVVGAGRLVVGHNTSPLPSGLACAVNWAFGVPLRLSTAVHVRGAVLGMHIG